MAVIIFALFKVSRLIVTGGVIWWNFLICKFHLGPKRPRGLRDPTVARLQRRMNNAVVEGRSHGRVVLVGRIIITLVFCVSTFFTIVTDPLPIELSSFALHYMIVMGAIIAIFGSMSAYRVSISRTHREFVSSLEGRKLSGVTALFLCMIFGMVRTFTMMQGPTVIYSLGPEVCQLAPMMPVYGGDLYFDRESSNFVVISSDKIAFYIPHANSQKVPACI